MKIVNGCGRAPNKVMIVGEAPGLEEANKGRPFVGKSGREQDNYLQRHGNLHSSQCYKTNVVKEYRKGNPDPTPAQVREWTPVLMEEVERVNPQVIIAVGRFATRWFLGDDVSMEMVHGLAHEAGAFDESRRARGGKAIVVPVYHPAFGLHDQSARGLIDWDYRQTCEVINGKSRGVPADTFLYDIWYEDISGSQLIQPMQPTDEITTIGIDTEGTPSNPWSIQISARPGGGAVLRVDRDDFTDGIKAIQHAINRGCLAVFHNAMYDIEMCRVMGLDLSKARIWDTMYAAYLLRTEPQGLKPLAYRWTGMRMNSYMDIVGGAALSKQLDYLSQIMDSQWPKPARQLVTENDGTSKLKQPQRIEVTAGNILVDVVDKKRNKDGELTDPLKRWRAIDLEVRDVVERVLGKMPVGTLDDVPLDEAVAYSARDADATLRLYHVLNTALVESGLDPGEPHYKKSS